MLIVDAHEDIAWNILTFGRDYTSSALSLRARESGTIAPLCNGNTLLGMDDWFQGQVGVIFATLFVAPERHRHGSWDTQCYRNARQAYRLARAQLDSYYALADSQPRLRLVANRRDLAAVAGTWAEDKPRTERQIGLIPLMEGAEPILEPVQVEEWFGGGVRIVGLAWEDTRYAGGVHEPGPLTAAGKTLLAAMGSLGMVLDLSHMAEEAYFQALDRYEGVMIASHANPRRFCPTPRGLSDRMITELAERDGVVGIVPYNAFLKPGWYKGERKDEVSLSVVADAVDHVCQITGSVRYVGIGSDFDGGFGVEHVPIEIDTVADLQKLESHLTGRGYSPEQVSEIFSGNWLRILSTGLPE